MFHVSRYLVLIVLLVVAAGCDSAGSDNARPPKQLTGPGAYHLIADSDFTCIGRDGSDHTGFDQQAVLISGRAEDLYRAYRRFKASLRGDTSRCIKFAVFTSQAIAKFATDYSGDYPESDLVKQWTNEILYENDPIKGNETWKGNGVYLNQGHYDFRVHVIRGDGKG